MMFLAQSLSVGTVVSGPQEAKIALNFQNTGKYEEKKEEERAERLRQRPESHNGERTCKKGQQKLKGQ